MLGNVGMALHHKLCHTLGGSFNLPHAEMHTVVLPHALAYNAAAAPEAMQRIARGAGQRATRAQAVFDLAQRQRRAGGAEGHRHAGSATWTARPTSRLQNPYPNPRPLERERDPRAAAAAPSTAQSP